MEGAIVTCVRVPLVAALVVGGLIELATRVLGRDILGAQREQALGKGRRPKAAHGQVGVGLEHHLERLHRVRRVEGVASLAVEE